MSWPDQVTVGSIGRRLLVAIAIGLSVAWLVWTLNGLTASDSNAYRAAAQRLLAGADLYPPAATQDAAFRYAPWFAAAWIPIAALPVAVGDLLWVSILVAAAGVAVVPLARRSDLPSRLVAILGGTMLLWTAARGNVHPLVIVALIHGLDRRSGPIWVAAAASLKAVPILFVLVYLARREWWRAGWTVAIALALVLPMPLLGWRFGSIEPGDSISLYHQLSPLIWAIVASAALLLAVGAAWRAPRLAPPTAAVAAILALPRLLLYDLTYLLLATTSASPDIARANGGADPP